MKPSTRVLIADDHALVADALAGAVAKWFEVVGVVTALERLQPEIRRVSPNVVLLDLQFGKTNVLSILAKLVDRNPLVKFVILTAHAEPLFAQAAITAGAWGYLVKTSAASELRVAIEEVMSGQKYVTPSMRVESSSVMPIPRRIGEVSISTKQREVLRLLLQGLSYSEIGVRLDVATKTVQYHVSMMTQHVGVSGRIQLIRWAEKNLKDDQ